MYVIKPWVSEGDSPPVVAITPEVAADFERLGTCHRKGESAVGVSTDSATPAI